VKCTAYQLCKISRKNPGSFSYTCTQERKRIVSTIIKV